MVFDVIETLLLVVPATILASAGLVKARGSARSQIIIAEATAYALKSRKLK